MSGHAYLACPLVCRLSHPSCSILLEPSGHSHTCSNTIGAHLSSARPRPEPARAAAAADLLLLLEAVGCQHTSMPQL